MYIPTMTHATEDTMTCNHALDEFNVCVYRCDAAMNSLGEDMFTGEWKPVNDEPQYDDSGNLTCDGEDDRTTFDMSDDADALASAGWGTDEDYGCYGGED
jgi:hypothetical protein